MVTRAGSGWSCGHCSQEAEQDESEQERKKKPCLLFLIQSAVSGDGQCCYLQSWPPHLRPTLLETLPQTSPELYFQGNSKPSQVDSEGSPT